MQRDRRVVGADLAKVRLRADVAGTRKAYKRNTGWHDRTLRGVCERPSEPEALRAQRLRKGVGHARGVCSESSDGSGRRQSVVNRHGRLWEHAAPYGTDSSVRADEALPSSARDQKIEGRRANRRNLVAREGLEPPTPGL